MLLSKVLNDFYVLPLGQSEIVGFHIEDLIQITWHDSETELQHEQEFKDQEIQGSSVIVRGAFDVTTVEGELVTFIALDGAALKPQRLLIVLNGGLVQTVLSEQPCEVAIIDYDTDGADDDEVSEIPQENGSTEEAVARIEDTVLDVKFIAGAFASIN